MKRLTLAAVLAAALPAFAQTYTVDARHTFPQYEVKHFGMSTQRGMFNKTTGKITLDRAAKKGTADIAIDLNSIVTGEPKLTDHLKNEDFFNVTKNPTATFKSSDFRFQGDKLTAVAGDLTLNGVTKPVTLNVEAYNCGDHPMNKKPMCGADLTATIKRTDFGVKYAVPAVGDDVKLNIAIEAFQD